MVLVTGQQGIPVNITTQVDSDGDVEVNANGRTILWILQNGDVVRCLNHTDSLEAMGFRKDGLGVKVI